MSPQKTHIEKPAVFKVMETIRGSVLQESVSVKPWWGIKTALDKTPVAISWPEYLQNTMQRQSEGRWNNTAKDVRVKPTHIFMDMLPWKCKENNILICIHYRLQMSPCGLLCFLTANNLPGLKFGCVEFACFPCPYMALLLPQFKNIHNNNNTCFCFYI